MKPWIPCIAVAAVVVVLAAGRVFRGPPAESPPEPPVLPTPPPNVEASYIQTMLRPAIPNATVVACPGRPGFYYAFDGEPDLTLVDGLAAEDDYADGWRGVVLVEKTERIEPHPLPSANPCRLHVGPFRFFGDAALVERVRRLFATGAP